jgi:hypothetical protein
VIAKGASRSGARQLAVYLMRVERWDTGEPAELLELRSPWAAGLEGTDRHHTAEQLIEAFRDWQTLVEGTKQGRDGLYHAEISPEAHYAREMTPEQWKRAAEILGEELGLQDQPCAMVLHAGKDDRPHLHVVWQRTDVDTMKVISDSYNYIAHERASQRMELEFGQEIVPGKHAKRDRKKQKDFPRSKTDQADHQQAQRTGLTIEQRKEQVTALRAAADNAHAFKAALEDAGYVLAKGDKRGLVIVDRDGEVYSLSKQVTDIKGKEFKAFMGPIDLGKLPSVDEANAEQERRKLSTVKIWGEARKQGVEASKFLRPDAQAKSPEPLPAQRQPDILPEKQETVTPRAPEGWTQKELTPQFPALQPPPAQPEPPSLDPEIEKLRGAILKRQKQEYRAEADKNADEYRVLQAQLKNSMPAKMEDFTIRQEADLQAFKLQQKPQREGLKGLLDKFRDHIDPETAAERDENRKQDLQRFRLAQRQERKDFIKQLRENNNAVLAALRARHLDEQKRREQGYETELERRLRDRQKAVDIAREQSEWAKGFEKEQEYRDGQEPPPPKLGK